ncbi:MAG: hypothetical protein KA314_12665 [Chloroflexi bacterium]|nr:hypothetical protein [Chloroflexota bacterium]MBP8056688.1 hypothetical protein [Chloroflexota bacterium]
MKNELEQLAREAGELAQQVMSGAGEKAGQQQAAQILDERLTALQAQAQGNSGSWLKWQEARRYLDVAQVVLRPHSETIPQQARRLSQEAFALAQKVALGQTEATILEKARAIDQQLPALQASQEELTTAERSMIETAVTEAQLDILYVLAEGKAPSSIRLFHFLQNRGNLTVSSQAVP